MHNKVEVQERKEVLSSSPQTTNSSPTFLTLQKAVDFGEYDPDFLGQFPEWHTLTRHIQFELIKKALENRDRQIWQHYAELN